MKHLSLFHRTPSSVLLQLRGITVISTCFPSQIWPPTLRKVIKRTKVMMKNRERFNLCGYVEKRDDPVDPSKSIFRALNWDQTFKQSSKDNAHPSCPCQSVAPPTSDPSLSVVQSPLIRMEWKAVRTVCHLFQGHKFPLWLAPFFPSPSRRFLGKFPISLGPIVWIVW